MKDNWNELTIGNEINFLGGFPFSSAKFNEEGQGVPLIRIRDLLKSSQETYFDGPYSDTYLVEEGDVLIGMDGDFHIVKWKNSPSLLNQRILRVSGKRKGKINIDFLFYYLNPFLLDVHNKTAATTVKHLSTFDISKAVDLFPPLPQQKKIAKILSTVDKVIEKTESAIAKYQAIKQGLMQDLFTRGIDVKTGKLRPKQQDAPELYKQSALGWIPREWESDNFEDATEIITDFTANGSFESLRVNVKYYYEVNYGRLIRLTDLRQNLQTDGVYVDKAGFEFLQKSELRENDIMLANVGEYTGFACLMPKVNYPATIAPNMFLVRTDKEKFDSKFMYYFMTYPQFTTQVDNVSASSATKLLNKTNFRTMHIPKPKIEEQIQFGKKLESVGKKIQTEQQALTKYQQLKSGLMQDLLTGKVEVSVDEEIISN